MVYQPTNSQRISRICFELWGVSEEERNERMAQLCDGDADLLDGVRQRMEDSAAPETFLATPLAGNRADLPWKVLSVGDQLGPFRITAEIHQGGMGEVFAAVREQPFEQRVAIKVVRPDLVDEQTLRRFDEERRTLARLEHPHIATILDGGRTGQGHPYLAMEYVDGERIDDYCDRKQLSILQRIELFLKVCSAVAFAHQNTIIHRDLKPSNILVTENGRPVLLDFGIAKSLSDMPSPSETTLLEDENQTDGFVGTLLYASPEQARGSQLISTRSDVFSLGIILYELLTGYSPYAGTSSLQQLVESIERQAPIRPSQMLQETRQLRGKRLSRQSISLQRNERSPSSLQRKLRGELDAILVKALERKPNARYSSVENLAKDLERYLQGHPVAAFGQGTLYLMGKFFSRHRVAAIAVAAVLGLLTITGIFELRQRRLEETHRQAMERNEEKANELRNLIVRLTQLAPGDPFLAEELRQEIQPAGDQDWLAKFLNDRGLELEEQGRFEAAEILYRESFAMKERLYGPQSETLLLTLTNLGDVLAKTGKNEDAEEIYQKDLRLSEVIFGPESDDLSRTQLNLAVLYQDMGRLEDAAELLDTSLAIREKIHGRHSMRYTATLNALAYQRYLEGDYDEAERLYEHIRRQLHVLDVSPLTQRQELEARVMRNLALVHQAKGDLVVAEKIARQALHTFRHRHVHWRVADAESVLGSILADQGRALEAAPLLHDSYPIIYHVKGANARQTLGAMGRLREAGLASADLFGTSGAIPGGQHTATP